jgi:DNA-directed RNA polymerase specialized sigma subunit
MTSLATAHAVPLDKDTAKQLAKAGQKAAQATAERDRLIAEARAKGGTLREIADLVGLSHTAISKIEARHDAAE